jgi:hypothetical protein
MAVPQVNPSMRTRAATPPAPPPRGGRDRLSDAALLAGLRDAERLLTVLLLGRWTPKARRERWLAVRVRARFGGAALIGAAARRACPPLCGQPSPFRPFAAWDPLAYTCPALFATYGRQVLSELGCTRGNAYVTLGLRHAPPAGASPPPPEAEPLRSLQLAGQEAAEAVAALDGPFEGLWARAARGVLEQFRPLLRCRQPPPPLPNAKPLSTLDPQNPPQTFISNAAHLLLLRLNAEKLAGLPRLPHKE